MTSYFIICNEGEGLRTYSNALTMEKLKIKKVYVDREIRSSLSMSDLKDSTDKYFPTPPPTINVELFATTLVFTFI